MRAEIENWAKKYEELTNSDETIGAMAKYYTCTFMFDMEKAKVIIEMHDGKVKNINTIQHLLIRMIFPYELQLKHGGSLVNQCPNPCTMEFGLRVFKEI